MAKKFKRDFDFWICLSIFVLLVLLVWYVLSSLLFIVVSSSKVLEQITCQLIVLFLIWPYMSNDGFLAKWFEELIKHVKKLRKD